MTKIIDMKIVNSTACEKSFECLANQGNLCRIKDCIKDEVHFLECNEKVCKFKVSFGDDFFVRVQ